MIQFVNHIIYFFEVVIRKRPEMEIFASKDVPKNNTFFLILLFLHIWISDGSGDTKFLVLSKKVYVKRYSFLPKFEFIPICNIIK